MVVDVVRNRGRAVVVLVSVVGASTVPAATTSVAVAAIVVAGVVLVLLLHAVLALGRSPSALESTTAVRYSSLGVEGGADVDLGLGSISVLALVRLVVRLKVRRLGLTAVHGVSSGSGGRRRMARAVGRQGVVPSLLLSSHGRDVHWGRGKLQRGQRVGVGLLVLYLLVLDVDGVVPENAVVFLLDSQVCGLGGVKGDECKCRGPSSEGLHRRCLVVPLLELDLARDNVAMLAKDGSQVLGGGSGVQLSNEDGLGVHGGDGGLGDVIVEVLGPLGLVVTLGSDVQIGLDGVGPVSKAGKPAPVVLGSSRPNSSVDEILDFAKLLEV